MTTCFDPSFRYTKADDTDLRKKFKRIIQEQRKKAAEAAQAELNENIREFKENIRLMDMDYQQGDPYGQRSTTI